MILRTLIRQGNPHAPVNLGLVDAPTVQVRPAGGDAHQPPAGHDNPVPGRQLPQFRGADVQQVLRLVPADALQTGGRAGQQLELRPQKNSFVPQ